MTERAFWTRMDQISASKKIPKEEKTQQLANLLVLAYRNDLTIWISAAKLPDGQYHQGTVCLYPDEPNTPNSRFLLCYTSSRAGKKDNLGCVNTKLSAVLGNMLNKEAIGGLIFNQNAGESGAIIVPKFVMQALLGSVPPPEGFVDMGGIWNGQEVK